jgi:hypothetical protein
MTPGTFICDNNFHYSNGETGKKILIVLNDGTPGYYIVVKITSQNAYKGNEFGCQNNDRYPNFFLPKGCCCLKNDTWIQLDEYFEFTTHELLAKHFSGEMVRIGVVPEEIFKDLLQCAIDSEDILMIHQKELKTILKAIL